MSAQPNACGAVFLSYAREDAEPARRIAEALRGFGIEVWFDLCELRGGDVWDQKIRRQIKERSEEHTSELQSQSNLVCRLLLEKKNSIVRDAGVPSPGRTCASPLHRRSLRSFGPSSASNTASSLTRVLPSCRLQVLCRTRRAPP